MRWIKCLFAFQQKANLDEMSMWSSLRGAPRVCAAPSQTCSFHICFLGFFFHHVLYFPWVLIIFPLPPAFPSRVSKQCLREAWISDELILGWDIVMVYSVRVLLCCWCVCCIMCSDLSWKAGRVRQFTLMVMCTRARQSTLACKSHLLERGVCGCIINKELTVCVFKEAQ